tara:strand:- start:3238 stop:6012 length:2775 start_codon:yes stop_codon:yes gene_type:complete
MSTKYVSGRVKELKVGLSNYSETRESLSVIGNVNVGGIVTATSFSGSVSGASVSEWVLGADGTNNYTFTGPGLTGAENDPTIILIRGQRYNIKNSSGGHPFRVQSTVNGSVGTQYNDGITNNDAGNGTTLVWDVQFDAPDVLYYQCTSHANMGGKIYIGNSGNSATINNLKVTGISTYESPLDIESSVLITGITTVGGLLDINAGGQANTFKVEDLTDNRVVIAGTGGELEDNNNLTFDGNQFNVGTGVTIYQATGIVSATSFYGDGSSLTGIDASSLSFGGAVKAQANQSGVVVTGVLTATTFSGSGASLDTLNASELDSGTIPDARFPATLPAASGVNLTALNATNLGSGTVPDARFPATLPAISGANLTNLPTGINTGGTSDFATLNVSTLLDVDGHTELDDVNVSGVATIASAKVSDLTSGRVVYAGTGGELQDNANLTFDGSTLTANAFAGNGAALTNLSIPGISTGTTSEFSNLDLSGTLSVGGTSIFNSPIVGVATFSGAVTADAGLTASTAKISDLTDNRVVIVGTSGELEDTTKLTFDGSTLTVVGDASFTGNVSVAGTLTSEEKTNIDSIGIVTARTGVRVNSGGLVVTSGVSTFSDSVVASSAKVSDLTSGRVVVAGTAGELEDASTFTFSGGTVTANAFSGDGSALTGITAAGTGAIGGLTIKDESVTVGTAGSVATLDFKGSYISAIATAGASGVATITVSETPSFTTVNVTGISTFASSVGINTDLSVTGVTTFAGGVTFQSDTGTKQWIVKASGAIEPAYNNFFNIGDTAKQVNNIYTNNLIAGGNITANGNIVGDNSTNITGIAGITASGTVQAGDFDSTSDIRLKTNVQVIENPLAKVIQIEGVSFNWKEDNRPALGVIADQVQKIIPELVHGDNPKTVNYNGLIGLLIEAVKEQQIQIDELKSKLP